MGCRYTQLIALASALCLFAGLSGSHAAPMAAPVQASTKTSSTASGAALTTQPFDAADLAGHGRFIMAQCRDLQGRIWLATEDDGVYCYSPPIAQDRWKHYTIASGLGEDNSYSICCDRRGRIWVGHGKAGVSVFNGTNWKQYDQLTGPIGAHVFALAVSPMNGDVWIATETALCRYCDGSDDNIHKDLASLSPNNYPNPEFQDENSWDNSTWTNPPPEDTGDGTLWFQMNQLCTCTEAYNGGILTTPMNTFILYVKQGITSRL